MSDDKEKQVIEETRRNRSDIHTITGNLFKIRKANKISSHNEKDVNNPFMAILIVAGVIGITCLLAFIVLTIANIINP